MSILLLTCLSLLAISPVQTLAYVTPEEVLFENDFFFPPTNRDADERVAAQEKERVARLFERQQKELAERNPEQDSPLDEVLASLADAIKSIDRNGALTPDQRQDVRLLERIERRQQSASPQVLNSGAPLTPTGAGTFIAIGAIVSAAIWTLKRARNV